MSHQNNQLLGKYFQNLNNLKSSKKNFVVVSILKSTVRALLRFFTLSINSIFFQFPQPLN